MILLIRNGQFYHLPTFSNVVATGQDGLWMTEFKGGVFSSEPLWKLPQLSKRTWTHSNDQQRMPVSSFLSSATLLTSIVETDYSSWAVFVQCEEEGAGNKFLSTRLIIIIMIIMTQWKQWRRGWSLTNLLLRVLSRRPQLSPAEWLQVIFFLFFQLRLQ